MKPSCELVKTKMFNEYKVKCTLLMTYERKAEQTDTVLIYSIENRHLCFVDFIFKSDYQGQSGFKINSIKFANKFSNKLAIPLFLTLFSSCINYKLQSMVCMEHVIQVDKT